MKRSLFPTVLATVIFFIVVTVIIIYSNNNPSKSDVLKADVIIKNIEYKNEFHSEINVTVNSVELDSIFALESDIKNYETLKGYNLAPWEIIIIYHLKDGKDITRKYSKSGNDSMFKSFLNKNS